MTKEECNHVVKAPNPIKLSRMMVRHYRSAHPTWHAKQLEMEHDDAKLMILIRREIRKDLKDIKFVPDES